jgi:hypothetical protein
MVSYNLSLQEFLIKFQKNYVLNNDKDILLRFKEKICCCCNMIRSSYDNFHVLAGNQY